jgi:hypothetical protein
MRSISGSDAELQATLAGAVRRFAERLSDNPDLTPFGEPHDVTPTEAMVTITRMLEAVDVEIFELALWQTWGRP